MPDKAILGVDGGNTKTDFALLNMDGELLEWLRVGTCSHECLPGGYDEAALELQKHIDGLCQRHGIEPGDIRAAVMGLAGIDTQLQHREMMRATEGLGIMERLLVNDAFPTIKAVSGDGCGICSSCGTGVVTGGIDKNGKLLQVGGIGAVSGDQAGGSAFAAEALSAVYAACMRNGPSTSLTEPIMQLLGVADPELLLDAMSAQFDRSAAKSVPFTQMLFQEADNNDAVALSIVRRLSEGMADSVIGCWRRLKFDESVLIVQAGTLWAKIEQPQMRRFFEARVRAHIDQPVDFIRLVSAPPVAGACCWAMQIATGHPLTVTQREKICAQFSHYPTT